ncbi:hypothetical protein U1Q18_052680 [Sarracenia purpurea var. burkii]
MLSPPPVGAIGLSPSCINTTEFWRSSALNNGETQICIKWKGVTMGILHEIRIDNYEKQDIPPDHIGPGVGDGPIVIREWLACSPSVMSCSILWLRLDPLLRSRPPQLWGTLLPGGKWRQPPQIDSGLVGPGSRCRPGAYPPLGRSAGGWLGAHLPGLLGVVWSPGRRPSPR